MIKPLKFFITVISIAFFSNAVGQVSAPKLPFTMPQKLMEPKFKADTFNIVNYGAKGDGITKNTAAIAKAIDACSKAGGGVVLIPEGLWLTGPIELKSNVNIHAQKGALVLFSSDFNDYPMLISYYEGQSAWRCQSPLSGKNLENIAITGKGVFDGSGDTWRFVKKSKLTSAQWKTLVSSGGLVSKDGNTWYPSEKSLKGNMMYSSESLPAISDTAAYKAIKDYLRPVMVSLIQCKKVMLDGPTFQNSPSWCIHPLMCEHLTVKNVNVRNPWYAQNGDGIDIESCSIGSVDNCTFDVGDDAICIKSGKDAEGRKRGKPTEYFTITNNVVYHGHGGFVIGSEMSGGVRNLYVSNCTFLGTDIGLRFKSTRGRGGVVENIYISGISMINIPTEAIRFDMYYSGTSPVPEGDEKTPDETEKVQKIPAVDEGTPQFQNFYIKNIWCNGAEQAIFLQGLPEMSIKNIKIENSSFKTEKGFTCIEGDDIVLNNVILDIMDGDAANLENCKNITLKNFSGSSDHGKLLKVTGQESANISISAPNGKISENEIDVSPEVTNKIIIQ